MTNHEQSPPKYATGGHIPRSATITTGEHTHPCTTTQRFHIVHDLDHTGATMTWPHIDDLDNECADCGQPATGLATINDTRYCHGDNDPEPTCYMRNQWKLARGAIPNTGQPAEDIIRRIRDANTQEQP